MQPSDFLDLVKLAYSLDSDYAVMKRFGFSQTGVSNWRRNHRFPSNDVLVKFSQILDIHIGVLALHSMIWREKNPVVKAGLQTILDAIPSCDPERLEMPDHIKQMAEIAEPKAPLFD